MCQLGGAESLQPRPQTDIRRVGRLRLRARETLDHLDGGQLMASQQQLARQGGSIERSHAQDICHPSSSQVRPMAKASWDRGEGAQVGGEV